jgi:hypothetical protein
VQFWPRILPRFPLHGSYAPTPSSSGTSYPYAQNLPSSLLGADQIYIQVQLNASEENILAQFSRSGQTDNPDAPDIFDLDANFVPENSTFSLLGIGFAILVFTSMGMKNHVFYRIVETNL